MLKGASGLRINKKQKENVLKLEYLNQKKSHWSSEKYAYIDERICFPVPEIHIQG